MNTPQIPFLIPYTCLCGPFQCYFYVALFVLCKNYQLTIVNVTKSNNSPFPGYYRPHDSATRPLGLINTVKFLRSRVGNRCHS